MSHNSLTRKASWSLYCLAV